MKRKCLVIPLLLTICLFAACNDQLVDSSGKAVWLDELDLSKVTASEGTAMANTSIDGNSITLDSTAYERGISVNASSKMHIDLNGSATRFTAIVGVDDEVASSRMRRSRRRDRAPGTVNFVIVGDDEVLFESGVKMAGEEPNNEVVVF